MSVRTTWLAAGVLLVGLGCPAFGQSSGSGDPSADASGATAGPAWQELTPDERNRARENFERYQQLSPQEQEEIWRRYERWKAFPPERRDAIRERWLGLEDGTEEPQPVVEKGADQSSRLKEYFLPITAASS